jgi:hypothetical protein
LHCVKEEDQGPRPSRRKYEVIWEREASLPEHISKAWVEAGPKQNLGHIRNGLNKVMHHLQKWSKDKFGSVKIQLENPVRN